MSIQHLREERTAKAKDYRNTLDNNPGKLSEEVVAKLNELESDITALDERIAREEKIIQFAAEEVANINAAEHVTRKGKTEKGEISSSALLEKWMRGGDKAMSAEDWTAIRNTMSTTTAGEGGYTVATEVASTVLDAMKDFGGMRQVATVIRTAQGNPMSWPTSDGTAEVGEILAENASATDADPTFGTKALPVYKYSSKVVTVPIELLQDSSIDMEAFVRGRIAQRLGRITNTHFTVGDGNAKPTGIVAGTTVGKTGAAGQVATIIYADLVDMEHSVDPAYRNGAKWMFSDAMLKVIKKLLDSQNRPLWLPDVAGNAPASIMGYGYQINQDVAAPAASAKSLLFGDLSKYVIRDCLSLSYYRFDDSAFAKKGQVGFLAFMRSGGNYMDVGGSVKFYAHPAA